MTSTLPRVPFRTTPERADFLQAQAELRGISVSELINEALESYIPDLAALPKPRQRGRYNREIAAAMKTADKLTDGGRNDPAE